MRMIASVFFFLSAIHVLFLSKDYHPTTSFNALSIHCKRRNSTLGRIASCPFSSEFSCQPTNIYQHNSVIASQHRVK